MSLQYDLARWFRWGDNLVVPNVYFPFSDFEADLAVVTKAGYFTEVEIKASLSDWKADARKKRPEWYQKQWDGEKMAVMNSRPAVTKHSLIRSSGIHRRFYFAVTPELWEKRGLLSPDELPDWAGVLTYTLGQHCNVIGEVRKPEILKSRKLTDSERSRLMEPFYYRFWRQRELKFDPVPHAAVCECEEKDHADE